MLRMSKGLEKIIRILDDDHMIKVPVLFDRFPASAILKESNLRIILFSQFDFIDIKTIFELFLDIQ